jgi:hypothetical protein
MARPHALRDRAGARLRPRRGRTPMVGSTTRGRHSRRNRDTTHQPRRSLQPQGQLLPAPKRSRFTQQPPRQAAAGALIALFAHASRQQRGGVTFQLPGGRPPRGPSTVPRSSRGQAVSPARTGGGLDRTQQVARSSQLAPSLRCQTDGWLQQPVDPGAHVAVGYVAATDHEPERHVVVYTFDHLSRRRNKAAGRRFDP